MAKPSSPKEFRLSLPESREAERKAPLGARKVERVRAVRPPITAEAVFKRLKDTPGADSVLQKAPRIGDLKLWAPVAGFTVCQKTGTAAFLDVWDCDHFDGFTDMQANLADCRIWFAGDGFQTWDSPQTKTGRVNCSFQAPADGHYVCNVQLQSHGGPAQVECLIDSFNYGPLPFNGTIHQPHPANLKAGFHHFRIRQRSGSFFFHSLTVWKV
jgi:hypothetical protein